MGQVSVLPTAHVIPDVGNGTVLRDDAGGAAGGLDADGTAGEYVSECDL